MIHYVSSKAEHVKDDSYNSMAGAEPDQVTCDYDHRMPLGEWLARLLGTTAEPIDLIPRQGPSRTNVGYLRRAQHQIRRGEHHRNGPYQGRMHPAEEQAIRRARARLP